MLLKLFRNSKFGIKNLKIKLIFIVKILNEWIIKIFKFCINEIKQS